MTISINSLTPKSQIHQIQNLSKKEDKKLGELAKGKKDPLSDVVANLKTQSLDSSVRGFDVVEQGINSQQSALSTASGGLSSILENLQKMRESAVQASNGTLSSTDRANIQTQSDQLKDQINQTANTVEFSGSKLLDGSYSDKQVQTGPNGNDQVAISIDSATAESLGVNNIDLSTSEGATDAIGQIDNAIQQVASSMAQVGSSQNRLDAVTSGNKESQINLAKAKQTFDELDLAKATNEIKTLNLRKQIAMTVLSKSNKSNESTFSSII